MIQSQRSTYPFTYCSGAFISSQDSLARSDDRTGSANQFLGILIREGIAEWIRKGSHCRCSNAYIIDRLKRAMLSLRLERKLFGLDFPLLRCTQVAVTA